MQEADCGLGFPQRLVNGHKRFAQARRAAARSWEDDLARVVEAEILPRLMIAHSAGRMRNELAPPAPDLNAFVRFLLSPNGSTALTYAQGLIDRGLPFETALLGFLAPAAGRLGELWQADACDFVEVTLALARLQRILQAVDSESATSATDLPDAPRALFLPTPGESHSFGVAMVETFFRAAGWRAKRPDAGAYLSELQTASFDIIGFSLSCDRHLRDLQSAVRESRLASKNPEIIVLVGGQAFVQEPDLLRATGADGTAADAALAVRSAQSLLDRRARV